MIDFEKFIKKYYPNCDDNQKRYYNQIYQRFQAIVEREGNIPNEVEAYKELFIPQYNTVASKVFYLIRLFLLNLFKFIEEETGISLSDIYGKMVIYKHEDIMDDIYDNRYFFKSLDELNEYFDNAADSIGDTKKTSVLMIRCMALLCWYGIAPKRIVSIEKKNLNDETMSINVDGKEYLFDDKTYTYLKELKYAEGYNDLTLVWKDYVDSIYLFRGTRAPSFDTKSLSRRLYLFNMQFKSAGKIIDMSRLKINANFVFIRENFGANPTTQQLNEGFSNVTRKYRVLYKHQYTLWLKVNFEEVD